MRSLTIETTTRCNYRCPWCIKARTLNSSDSYLTAEEFERCMLFAQEKRINKFTISGGEPLCCPHKLLCMLREIRGAFPKAAITVATNGTGLTERIAKFFNDRHIAVLLSVEAEGYKGLKMLVENAAESEKVISNLNSVASISIRSVQPMLTNLAANIPI